jgi:phosphatidylglycerol:prolipoprotein diacylglycerol transferase
MWPTLLKLGPVALNSYGLMIAIGFLTALHFIQKETSKQGINPDVMNTAAFWSLILGIAGTRVLHILMFPSDYSWNDPVGWIAIWRGGLVFQGGPPVVMVFLYFYLKKKKVPFLKVVDIAGVYLPLAHAIGRLGCFFKGCCYGKVTDVAWGVSFPRWPRDVTLPAEDSPAYLDQLGHRLVASSDLWSAPVHATQLYESAGLVLIAGLLFVMRKKWHPFDGVVLPAYLALYGVLRFVVEIYRGDNNPTMFNNSISEQQLFSLIFIVLAVFMYFALRAWSHRVQPGTGTPSTR